MNRNARIQRVDLRASMESMANPDGHITVVRFTPGPLGTMLDVIEVRNGRVRTPGPLQVSVLEDMLAGKPPENG
jgi:hypothetical protein